MPRVKIGLALPDREKLDAEIARLRDLEVGQLRSRWHTAFGRPAPAHLARHLLFRSLAYRLQADRLGDLDGESQRLLDRSGSPEKAGRNAVDLSRHTTELRPGNILGREWNGQMQQVAVLADGFAWNGNTYPSLSKAAFARACESDEDRLASARRAAGCMPGFRAPCDHVMPLHEYSGAVLHWLFGRYWGATGT